MLIARSLHRLGVVVIIALGGLLAARSASAQDIAAAEALFREGRELMEKGDYANACKKLAESQRLDASSGTLLNLATCHVKQGKTATAWAEYLLTARQARAQGKEQRAEEAQKRAAELEPDLSYLTIVVTQPVPGLEIQRDDVKLEASTLGSKIPIDPGEHSLAISAPGYKPLTLTVKIGEKHDAQTLTVPALEKAPEGTAAGPPSTASPPPSTGTTPAGNQPAPVTPPAAAEHGAPVAAYVIGGIGVVSAVVGGVFGVLALSEYSDADEACPSHSGCSHDAIETRDEAGVRANIANVGIGIGIVGIGIGAVLLITSHSSDAEADHARRSERERSARWVGIEPYAGTSQAGVRVSGAF